MRGFARKRGKTWTAYWDTADADTGRRKQRTKGGFRTQKDAQTHLNTVLPAVAAGTYTEPSKIPFGQYLAREWVPSLSGRVRPLTADRYSKIARLYVAERDNGAIPLRTLSGGHLTALYGELAGDGLSPGTIRLVHNVLTRALNDAVRWGKIGRNPARSADTRPLPRSRAQSWSARELRAFRAHVERDRLFGLWRLAATTGMRRGELGGLTWRHLDLDAGRLRVEQQLVPTNKGGAAFGPPKSRRSERTIALDPATVDALRHHRDTQQLERDLAGARTTTGISSSATS